MGGPSGGDGGNGGSVWLESRSSLFTLNEFLFEVHFKADRGQHGLGDNKTGRRGEDLVIGVPLGTQVYSEKGKLLADLTEEGERFLAARGGLGGRGNLFFASGQYKAPKFGELGEVGQERWLKLVLKMVADVGLIGFPNVGKSTLLAAVEKPRRKSLPIPSPPFLPTLAW